MSEKGKGKGRGKGGKKGKKGGKRNLNLDERWSAVESGWELPHKDDWDAENWLKLYDSAGGYEEKKMLRVQVAVHTVRHSLRFFDEISKARLLVKYYPTPTTLPPTLPLKTPTDIQVWEGDCLAAGLLLQDMNLNPVVLNMANQSKPGGGWLTGSGAQEENMFRRTSYWASLQEDSGSISPSLPPISKFSFSYPMSSTGVIYSPDVMVFRDTEQLGYPYLATPRSMSFIACAAYRKPPCGPGPGFDYLSNEHKEGMAEKIKGILAAVLHHGHDSVVLSAFGCGAFCNPPNVVAEIFADVLQSERFKDRFKTVVFAIFNDHNACGPVNPIGNLAPFEHVFGPSKKI
eukprot:TRINITY_DN4132_c0_g2_i2.p1 TRINITY_DN4132_c0_g2~~TRINITY_DN4132_c0_g2_i2.p1  ORF type:complete len:364 (+),score=41.16 TRINITY_DN4132_c0_g2_i2:58-1092(+)